MPGNVPVQMKTVQAKLDPAGRMCYSQRSKCSLTLFIR